MSKTLVGNTGEKAACSYIASSGMQLIARNYRKGVGGEIDIIARDGETIAFIEVKTRTGTSYGTPAEAVTPAKITKIVRTAEKYIMENKLFDCALRFDVAEVYYNSGRYSINYIKNAFEA